MFDPHHPTLKARIARGDCLGAVWLSLGSAAIVELAARARPDAIVLDLQHGLWERREMEAAIGVVPSDIPVLVRVAENSAIAIGGALDAGAEGVIVPLIENAHDAELALRHSRFPPLGQRSAGGVRPLQDFAAYLAGAPSLVTMLMIETAAGLAQADAIAKTEGLDMVFIGGGDLALSLGVSPADAMHAQACEAIRSAALAVRVPCGIFTSSADAAASRRAQGYSMVVVATDGDLIARGFRAACDGFRASPGITREA